LDQIKVITCAHPCHHSHNLVSRDDRHLHELRNCLRLLSRRTVFKARRFFSWRIKANTELVLG
jgi:hypothetical protein